MKNKTVLVTGAARRIGAGICRYLHNAGMDIILHYHTSKQEVDELRDQLNILRPDSAFAIQTNLMDEDHYQILIEQAIDCTGRLDVLVNNASLFYATPVDSINLDHWHELMNVNLKAPLFLSTHAVPELKRHQGCIVNITDIHAERPLKDHPVYSMAKAGLDMLTRALAKELAPEVRVNGIAPGAITWPEQMDENTKGLILSRIALQRQGKVEDVAKAVHYLIENANYVTGQIINVDGGRTLFS